MISPLRPRLGCLHRPLRAIIDGLRAIIDGLRAIIDCLPCVLHARFFPPRAVNWMQDSEKGTPGETLSAQYSIVVTETNKSHPLEFGDMSIASAPIANFQGSSGTRATLAGAARHPPRRTARISTRARSR